MFTFCKLNNKAYKKFNNTCLLSNTYMFSIKFILMTNYYNKTR